MTSHATCHAETVERHIRRMSMLSGGFVFEVSVTMTKAARVSKRFDNLDRARKYRDMLLLQRDRLKKRRAS